VLPTPTGDAAILCDAPEGSSVDSSACARIAEHVRVNGSTALPGPDRSLRTDLAPTFIRLSRLPRKLAPRGNALPARERAAAAAALTVTRAAAVVDGLDTAPRYALPLDVVRGALEQEASSLSALAAAAGADHPTTYAQQASVLEGDSVGLQAAVRDLNLYGLRVRVPGQLQVIRGTPPQ
jgi:hypothetical protein